MVDDRWLKLDGVGVDVDTNGDGVELVILLVGADGSFASWTFVLLQKFVFFSYYDLMLSHVFSCYLPFQINKMITF